jgi:hypothetical protein
MPLDFRRATDLFMGTEEELSRALRVDPGELRRHRGAPATTPAALLHTLSDVLDERGRAMIRVAEMLREEADDDGAQGNGAG